MYMHKKMPMCFRHFTVLFLKNRAAAFTLF